MEQIRTPLMKPSQALAYLAEHGLAITGSTLRRWVDAEQMPAVVLPSKQRRYRQSDLDAVLAPANAA